MILLLLLFIKLGFLNLLVLFFFMIMIGVEILGD